MRILLFAALVLALGSPALADSSPGTPAKEKSPTVLDWKADPACRLVFYAVLEGLYEDGVSDEVVNSIVPPDKKGREKMRHSFVLDCPLCQPAYEAFCVYQSRPRFTDDPKASSFGKGLPEDLTRGLMSKELATRLITLRKPIKVWVERRLVSMKLSDKEREKWWADISARVAQGKGTLSALQLKDPWYKDWSGYWGCAACLGSQDACRNLGLTPAKK